MEKNKLNDSMISVMIEEEAWKNLSSNYPWTEEQLSKYSNKLAGKKFLAIQTLNGPYPYLKNSGVT